MSANHVRTFRMRTLNQQLSPNVWGPHAACCVHMWNVLRRFAPIMVTLFSFKDSMVSNINRATKIDFNFPTSAGFHITTKTINVHQLATWTMNSSSEVCQFFPSMRNETLEKSPPREKMRQWDGKTSNPRCVFCKKTFLIFLSLTLLCHPFQKAYAECPFVILISSLTVQIIAL